MVNSLIPGSFYNNETKRWELPPGVSSRKQRAAGALTPAEQVAHDANSLARWADAIFYIAAAAIAVSMVIGLIIASLTGHATDAFGQISVNHPHLGIGLAISIGNVFPLLVVMMFARWAHLYALVARPDASS